MEGREEQPSSTDELAYGRPAEPDEHDRQPAGDPGAPQGAPDQAGSPRPQEPGGAPMGPEGAGGPATAAPARPAETGPAPGDPGPQPGHDPAGGGPAGTGGPGAEQGGEPAGPPSDAGATPGPADPAPGGGHSAGGNGAVPLLSSGDSETFERRWQDIQVGFVDQPSRCVEQADTLVADVMKRLAEGFAQERKSLESQWSQGGEVSTEDLRVALQRYRSFFNRLLSTSG